MLVKPDEVIFDVGFRIGNVLYRAFSLCCQVYNDGGFMIYSDRRMMISTICNRVVNEHTSITKLFQTFQSVIFKEVTS